MNWQVDKIRALCAGQIFPLRSSSDNHKNFIQAQLLSKSQPVACDSFEVTISDICIAIHNHSKTAVMK